MRLKRYFFIIGLVSYSFAVKAQSAYQEEDDMSAIQPTVALSKTDSPPVIDGILDEDVWEKGQKAQDFWQHFPTDTTRAKGQTDIYMIYDEAFLYVGIRCQSIGNQFITPSLRRDYSFQGSDNISIMFDTYNDNNNAFLFGINAMGVCREALIVNGGRQRSDFQDSWDNKWYGEAKIFEDYWTAEMAIPFKTLRFKEGVTSWRFNSYRSDTQLNELSAWMNIPRNQIIMSLSYMGDMVWDKPLEKAGKNISVIPYLAGGLIYDFENPAANNPEANGNIGMDAKVAVTSGLNLDFTVNPDFSQVEVDRQVTNLDRFELFFPERRQFFLENADLFGSFGQERINPFFSRRIGIALDSITEENIENNIYYGVRLSGKLDEKLRVGLLNMQTAREKDAGVAAANYTVAALQRQVSSASNVSFIFVDKEQFQVKDHAELDPFNRIAGLEYRLGTRDNSWQGKLFYHQAFLADKVDAPFAQGLQLQHFKRKYRFLWEHNFVGFGYDAQVGFVPRKDFFMVQPEAEWFFYPAKGYINEHSFELNYIHFYNMGHDTEDNLADWATEERQARFNWNLKFRDNARGFIGVNYSYIFLEDDFDPTQVQEDESIALKAGTAYSFAFASANFSSDIRKRVFYTLNPVLGQFFNGHRLGMSGELGYRFQPYGSVVINFNYNRISLQAPFEKTELWLLGPRIDLTFSKNVFLTTFVQYNNQEDNLNINARFQWRFKPVSDFFLVYTDNYFAADGNPFFVRNRALVAKITYWLNL
ncbi:MAG TPA: DUF5916 domain-containing protein [Saprospiraceae bacterium]|mgnify:CR=1 FL=1|nr:DUF5916 domain-containing protein [Saprospiraceae bacterium]HMQ84968.1 DUF5916 domain-containing protein [Saprospiraceae bacterium]